MRQLNFCQACQNDEGKVQSHVEIIQEGNLKVRSIVNSCVECGLVRSQGFLKLVPPLPVLEVINPTPVLSHEESKRAILIEMVAEQSAFIQELIDYAINNSSPSKDQLEEFSAKNEYIQNLLLKYETLK